MLRYCDLCKGWLNEFDECVYVKIGKLYHDSMRQTVECKDKIESWFFHPECFKEWKKK